HDHLACGRFERREVRVGGACRSRPCQAEASADPDRPRRPTESQESNHLKVPLSPRRLSPGPEALEFGGAIGFPEDTRASEMPARDDPCEVEWQTGRREHDSPPLRCQRGTTPGNRLFARIWEFLKHKMGS